MPKGMLPSQTHCMGCGQALVFGPWKPHRYSGFSGKPMIYRRLAVCPSATPIGELVAFLQGIVHDGGYQEKTSDD